MIKTIFETTGLLPTESLTILGLSSKPNTSSPMGCFGTGLKNALAILARTGVATTISIGNDRYTLQTEQSDFRGYTYSAIFLLCEEDGTKIILPFTTNLGKDWELWEAFRELYCNTLDEKGVSYTTEGEVIPSSNNTQIIIEGEEFAEIYNNRYRDVFIPEEVAKMETSTGVQVVDSPSDYIFYRGVRVYRTEKPCAVTYNILSPITLTENRTIAKIHEAKQLIEQALLKEQNKKVLEKILNCSESDWENCLSFYIQTWTRSDVSEVFAEVGASAKNHKVRTDLYKTSESYLKTKEEEETAKKENHFITGLCDSIEDDDWEVFTTLSMTNSNELLKILKEHLNNMEF